MPALKNTVKKRLSASQGGTEPKKPRVVPPKTRVKAVQKRRRPVTLSDKELDEEDSDAADEDQDTSQVEDDAVFEEDGVTVDNPAQKAVATRSAHKEQRILHEQRKAVKPHSLLLANAKRVWSLARQKNIPPAERRRHVCDLMNIVRGNVKDIVFKHDASRIIQTIVKYGSQVEREQVAGELMGHFRQLAQGKYSKFLVSKLIRHCPTHRGSILSEFQSHVLRLLLHREATNVLADAFELYANAYERSIILRDFYGKEATLFSSNIWTETGKEKAKRGLRGVLECLEGDRRRRVLTMVKENLTTILNNPDKGAVTHVVVHRVLWEYLTSIHDIQDDVERDKLWREMFESCQEVLAEMVHTKDGSRAVREFLAHGSAKDRKHVIKVIKPHVARMCMDDEAELVIFTALDVIDDTKLTTKSLVSEITSNVESFTTSPQGRRSLFYLLVPRTRRHFTPAQISVIAETDGAREKTSKKDSILRAAEIRQAASPGLLKFVQERGAEVARDTGGCLVVLEIMLYAEGDKTAAISALVEPLASAYPSRDPARSHSIDLAHTSRMYKSLFQGGHFCRSTESVERTETFLPSQFASTFLSRVDGETVLAMAMGNGAFVVAEFLERIREEGSDEDRKKVKGWFSKEFVSKLHDSEVKGKEVLVQKIDAL